jgi:hypothetical protein
VQHRPPHARVAAFLWASLAVAAAAAGAALGGCSDARRAVAALAARPAPADTAAGEVPFRFAGPGGAAIVVAVAVDGRAPVDLILDTARP